MRTIAKVVLLFWACGTLVWGACTVAQFIQMQEMRLSILEQRVDILQADYVKAPVFVSKDGTHWQLLGKEE